MARADYLELDFGASGWMKRAHGGLVLLCILAIVIAPASWTWKISVGSVLAVIYLLACRVTKSSENSGVVRIFKDNTAMLSTASERRVFATLAARHWISPWFCSVAIHLAKGGSRRFLIVCATANDPDEYRRLLKFLRMSPQTAETEKMIW